MQNVQITKRSKALGQNTRIMKKSYTKYIKSAYNGPHKYFIPYSLIKGLTIAQYRNTTILDSAQSAETAGLAGFALTITLKTVTGCCSIQSAGAM